MSYIDDYDDLEMWGLDPALYSRIPRRVQDGLRSLDNDLRAIWNHKLGCVTVLVRNPAVVTKWHDSTHLRGWGIALAEWNKPWGDGSQIAEEMSKMICVAAFGSLEEAEAAFDQKITDSETKAQKYEDDQVEAFVDSEYPKTDAEAEAFNRDVARQDAQLADKGRAKLWVPATGSGTGRREFVPHLVPLDGD